MCLLTFVESKGVNSQTTTASVKKSPQSANTILTQSYMTYASIHLNFQATIHYKGCLSHFRLEHVKDLQLIQPTTVADKSRIDAPKAKCSLTSSPFKVVVSFGAVAKGRRLEQVDSSKQISNFIK